MGGANGMGGVPGLCNPYQDAGAYFAPRDAGTDGGCGTQAELCFAAGRANCGMKLLRDRCDALRTIDCGTCAMPNICGGDRTQPAAPNHCGGSFCVPESDTDFCQRFGADCGDFGAQDNCGRPRRVDCGSCVNGTCGAGNVPNVCVRPCGETPGDFCRRHGLEFGTLQSNNCCALNQRTVCGVGTPSKRMAFALPALPPGPGFRCWAGRIPRLETASEPFNKDPELVFDGNVGVELQNGGVCLTGAVVGVWTGTCFGCTAVDGGLSCIDTNAGVRLWVTPTTVTGSIDGLRGGNLLDNSMFVLKCDGTRRRVP